TVVTCDSARPTLTSRVVCLGHDKPRTSGRPSTADVNESGRRGPAAKQVPRRPGTAPALGLPAGTGCPPSTAYHNRKGERIMWFRQWLRSLLPAPAPTRTRRRRPAPCRPSLEALEARVLPSIDIQFAGGYLTGGTGTQSVATGDFNHDGAAD